MNIHILATCRKPELLRATTLVFDTIRIGFPTEYITVYWNGVEETKEMEVTAKAASNVTALFVPVTQRTHHQWVSDLIKQEENPFWICDTDVVFFNNFEKFDFEEARLAGRLIPQFRCKFANAITKPRLHTCLLRIDPVKVRAAIACYGARFPDAYCTPRPTLEDLVYPRYVPDGKRTFFYDTTSLLYQAIGGEPFQPEHLDAVEHLNSGTISDLVAPAYPEYRMRETHFAIFENPQLAKGSWKLQDEFYARHAC